MFVCNVVGARPNFMKIAPVVIEMKNRAIPYMIVHTGQHYDQNMSSVFFEELDLPKPDIYLDVGSGTHAEQTAKIMTAFEKVCLEQSFDLVVVGGDVNSTLACSLVAAKLNIPVAHVEAGLRSFDRTMPEEINRVVTDHLSRLLFTTEPSGKKNLLTEGVDEAKIHFVGNCMIDSLFKHRKHALLRKPWEKFDLMPGSYGLVTLHRPANVDYPDILEGILKALRQVAEQIRILFPMHPRTRKRLQEFGYVEDRFIITEPLGYLDFLGVMDKASVVLTDSGGIQEETTALGIPCITLRENTERPITVEQGTNNIVGTQPEAILHAVNAVIENRSKATPNIPPLWDGHAAKRVMDVIEKWGDKESRQ